MARLFSEADEWRNPSVKRQGTQPEFNDQMDRITEDATERAIAKVNNTKAVGPDDLPAEDWKCMGNSGAKHLKDLFNRPIEDDRILH